MDMGATYRVGHGFDLHRLEPGAALRIGCVDVPAKVQARGHSDGDALAHAVCDAVLGALALGDIGRHFPPDDPRWRGVSSGVFLERAAELARARGARVVNIDATVILERPRIADFTGRIREALAAALGCAPDAISVKAKTAEGLGPIGEGRAIAAHAVALLEI